MAEGGGKKGERGNERMNEVLRTNEMLRAKNEKEIKNG